MNAEDFRRCLKSARAKNRRRYFSRFIFTSAVKDGGNLFPFAAGTEVAAFGYAIGDASSDFIVGDPTTSAALATAMGRAQRNDTNVVVARETEKGSDFYIQRIGIQLNPNSDAEAVAGLFPELNYDLQFDDQTVYHIGPAGLAPGGGGLAGAGSSNAIVAAGATRSYGSNGFADAMNMLDLGMAPIKWGKDGIQKNLSIKARLGRAISIVGAAGGTTSYLRLDGLIVLDGVEITRMVA
jgi:hypothetical protein